MSIKGNNDEERLIQKIRKLFALSANGGATGAESETALRMANALLAKHSIDKFKLHEADHVFASFCEYPIKHDWIQKVCSHICKLYNCRVIFDYNWPEPKTLIIGTSSNRITVMIVIDQLLEQIKKESKGEKIAFKNGAAHGLWIVCKRIIDERNAIEDEVIPGTGISVIDLAERLKIDVDEFVSSNFKNLVRSKGRPKMSAEGIEYGKGLNPGARMNGAGQKCLN